ncbi:MAG: cytochrome c [Phenylobacterium sp.]
MADGAKTYQRHCSVCHQAGGVGREGVYPRLAGRAPDMARKPAGRKLMASAVLWGMAGKLVVDGKPLMGVMPGFTQLSDADLAEVLTYVAGLGGKPAPAFTTQEVAGVRAAGRLAPMAVNALAKTVPAK